VGQLGGNDVHDRGEFLRKAGNFIAEYDYHRVTISDNRGDREAERVVDQLPR
jgi:hypothetical protein